MTKGEYINELQKKADKANNAFSKQGIRRKAIVTGGLALGSALICLVGANISSTKEKATYDRFIAEQGVVQLENLGYKDTYDVWNAERIGNDANCLLAGGELYSRNGVEIIPNDDTTTLISGNAKISGTLDSSATYINVWNDKVIYRNSKRAIVAYDLNSKKQKVIRSDNVGEVFVADGKIYFVDLGNNRQVYSIDMDGSNLMLVIESPVDSFAVFGDSIVYRGFDNNLCNNSMGSETVETLGRGVERFFVTSGLVLESGNEIYRTDSLGRNPEQIYVSDDDSMRLVGAAGQTVFIQEGGKLFSIKDGERVELSKKEFALYSSLCVNDNKLTAIAIKDEKNAPAERCLFTVNLLNPTAGSETKLLKTENPVEEESDNAEQADTEPPEQGK